MNQDFLDFLVNSMPLSNESYNFLVFHDGRYVNLGISPLYKDFIAQPFALDIEVGKHKFIAETNKPVYLIEDSPELEEYALGEPIVITTPFNPKGSILVYPAFRENIDEYMDLKIENGNLYYKDDEGSWIHDSAAQ